MRVFGLLVLALFGLSLSGCAAIAVVDTAVGVATTVVGTTVDVAAGAVRTVSGSSTDVDDIDCDDEDNKDEDVCKKKAEKKVEDAPK